MNLRNCFVQGRYYMQRLIMMPAKEESAREWIVVWVILNTLSRSQNLSHRKPQYASGNKPFENMPLPLDVVGIESLSQFGQVHAKINPLAQCH